MKKTLTKDRYLCKYLYKYIYILAEVPVLRPGLLIFIMDKAIISEFFHNMTDGLGAVNKSVLGVPITFTRMRPRKFWSN